MSLPIIQTIQTNINNLNNSKLDIKNAVNTDYDFIANEQIESYPSLIKQGIAHYKNRVPHATKEGTDLSFDAVPLKFENMTIKGDTSQASYAGKNLLQGIELGDINPNTGAISSSSNSWRSVNYIEYDTSFTYYFSINSELSTVTINLRFYNKDYEYIGYGTLKGSGSDFNITKTTSVIDDTPKYFKFRTTLTNIPSADEDIMISTSSDTTYEPYCGGIPAPNPDYPQQIHVVTGNNTIGITGKNLFSLENDFVGGYHTASGTYYGNTNNGIVTKNKGITLVPETYIYSFKFNENYVPNQLGYIMFSAWENSAKTNFYGRYGANGVNNEYIKTVGLYDTDNKQAVVQIIIKKQMYIEFSIYNSTAYQNVFNFQLEKAESQTEFEPYYHQDYPVNLGSIELCKIGNYQDYLYKENGNWYKYGAIEKLILDGTWSNTSISSALTNTTRMYLTSIQEHASMSVNDIPQFCDKLICASINGVDKEGCYAGSNRTVVIRLNKERAGTTKQSFNEYLAQNNITIYYVIQEAVVTQITDTTLISQLNELDKAKGNNGTTIITSNGDDLAPILNFTAYLKEVE